MISKLKGKKNILLVEDDQSLSAMLKLLLESRGFEVNPVYCGASAIEHAQPATDLIILDLTLPDQDGFEVCRKLKNDKNTAGIPIIILSAKLLPEDIIEGLYLGADDYLTKPFECEELIARIKTVIRRGSITNKMQAGSLCAEEHMLELRSIIDEERVVPYFQPIFLLKPFKVLGFEALCRPSTDTALANPEVLFKAAMEFGLYTDLEMLSWRKAIECADRKLAGCDKHLFLNCNPYLIQRGEFSDVKKVFENSAIKREHVVLEITERSAVVDFEQFYTQLQEYRGHGFKFAIDDVGGGYASLESIVETKPEVVKIDRHIVKELAYNRYKLSIVKFIVAFCKENGILSIAEGIETKEDLAQLINIGVDAGQGYYLFRPSNELNVEYVSQAMKSF